MLTACDANPVLSNFARLGQEIINGPPPLPLSREDIANLPYASMAARIGRSPESLLVLGRIDRQELHWISSDSGVVVTRGGRIVKTAGFSDNLRGTRSASADPVDGSLHQYKPHPDNAPFIRYLDFDSDRYYGLEIHSQFQTIGATNIDILEINFDVIHIVETAQAQNLNWSYENHYWVDPGDGYIWQSQQHFARTLPPLEFSILKPPALG